MLNHFLATGRELKLPASRFLKPGPLTFEVLLRALEFRKLVLHFVYPCLHLLTRGRAIWLLGSAHGDGCGQRLTRVLPGSLEIIVHELRCIKI
jgi:hypothetical protein